MEEIKLEPQKVERALLVGIQEPGMTREEAEEHLEELASLTDTMGVGIVAAEVARVGRPSPRYYLGSGKAEELKQAAEGLEADVLIFDTDLSPSQQRNWEELLDIAVIDRQEVILDIFAGRAQTREARLQVGLARMEYSLPRLRRKWTHLERQRGGAGLRGGPGELQLEVDRRIVQDRITHFKRQLVEVRKQRAVQRHKRGVRPVPVAAIVGYTNAGKSSLLRAMTGADVFIEDKLFATLDPTTRRVELPNHQPLLLTDTVGFIRKLPHNLIEAFKSTLEEAVQADFLMNVLDATSPALEDHYEVTCQVLDELGATDKPTIIVLNKIDQGHDPFLVGQMRNRNPEVYPVSAHTGEGLPELLEAMAGRFTLPMRTYRLHVPMDRFDVVGLIHREGDVLEEEHKADGVWIEASMPVRFEKQIEGFIRAGSEA